ncbi:hypothetical protein ACSLBF_18335 (plasmid) [Pseudoalteromonas sp. T1lg65]|uniref:hypothetical protein n=1 Tax=Pseudoalteromonas sp. T1lg65 TaxID=2077101 RepID=UPI003F7AD206
MKRVILSILMLSTFLLTGCESTDLKDKRDQMVDTLKADDAYICIKEKKLGTRFAKEKCMTKEQHAYMKAYQEKDTQKMQRAMATRGGRDTRNGGG